MDGADEPRPQVGGGLYGYIPTLWICALFIALYSVSTSRSECLHVDTRGADYVNISNTLSSSRAVSDLLDAGHSVCMRSIRNTWMGRTSME